MPTSGTQVLQVSDLRVWYQTGRDEVVRAVDGVSFDIRAGERFGLAGESGSGKSTLAMALMGMIKPPGRIESGRIELGGQDIAALDEEAIRKLRLADISIIPQGAMNSLNPVRRVRDHFRDNASAHENELPISHLRTRMVELLEMVGLGADVADRYPHELSGGMKQRVCIALAIMLRPRVIIADEPTSALDVVVQRQVVQTLRAVQEELGAAVLLVGHDMGLLAQFVNRLGVMYAGRLVEVGPVRDVFARPTHPYTQMLISSLPRFDERISKASRNAAEARRFTTPNGEVVELEEIGPDHWVLPFSP
ncbi:ABC transporter ATP-binding protein [Tenggerimyces flavus]|uniref:ABC transporter ATP-binding protein n=1 Tax=Tenggerimyces flavus TaxID=1708749 RepID=A0ABV7Y7F3_9ACTN|nr:ABC transporter ATP-binding protein [Tenggerimyces flavus]MBM7785420.1 peptide/nickel transport system ATP-binding protein [Tenggerimyces flavus]